MFDNTQKSRSRVNRWIPLLALATVSLAAPLHTNAVLAANSSSATTEKIAPQAIGLKVAVVAVADEANRNDVALRALQAANIGLQRQPGYQITDPASVADKLQQAGLQWPFAPKQYPDVQKALRGTDRILSLSVSPQNGAYATYKAVAELYDIKTGGLVGRGQSLYTVSPPATDSKQDDAQFRAVDGAVLGAIADMSKPAVLNGVVISRPQGYTARLSLGSLGGLRNGARIEYLSDGTPIAYGTVIDLGSGESVATIAPESAYNKVLVNTSFRTADIPPIGLMGKSRQEISKKEFDEYSKEFGVSSVIASLAYLIIR